MTVFRVLGAALLAAVFTSGLPDARADTPRGVVRLVILGDFPTDLTHAVSDGLARELGVSVTPAVTIAMPAGAWYPPRSRWRADRLLDVLPGLVAPGGVGDGERILGLTTKDISTTKDQYPDWGVFGLGEMPGDAAVISSFRLTRRASPELVVRRVVSTAVHEVGHTFGLAHCAEAGCVMQDAEGGIANTDSGTGHLGPGCRALLDGLAPG